MFRHTRPGGLALMKPLLKDVLTPLRWEDDGVMKKHWRALGSGGLDSLTMVCGLHDTYLCTFGYGQAPSAHTGDCTLNFSWQ